MALTARLIRGWFINVYNSRHRDRDRGHMKDGRCARWLLDDPLQPLRHEAVSGVDVVGDIF